MPLIAQIAERTWQDQLYGYGPLGIFAALTAIALCWAVREGWKVYKPYCEAKLEAEIERSKAEAKKEDAQAKYVQRITESHSEDMECKRRQVALLEKMDARQSHHAESCDATHKLLDATHKMVDAIHEKILAKGH